ncbi:hypothetical protein ACTFIR_005293 [Dictyostelium discoideum]
MFTINKINSNNNQQKKIKLTEIQNERKKYKSYKNNKFPFLQYKKTKCIYGNCKNKVNINSGYCYHHSIQGNIESCKKSLVIPPMENNVLGCKVCSIPKNICVDDHIDQTYQKLVKIDQSCYKYLYSNYHCKLSIKDCNVNHTTLSTINEEKDLNTCDYLACANGYYTYDKCKQNRPCKLHPNFNKYSYRFNDGNFY